MADPTYSLRSRRALQHQCLDAAGAAPDGHHPRAWLAADAHLRHVDAGRYQPRPRRIDVGDPPAQAIEPVLRLVHDGLLPWPAHDLDDEIAATEEHQLAPIGMRPVERHVEAKPCAVQRGCALAVRGRDYDMIKRGDWCGRRRHRARTLIFKLEEEQPDAARGLGCRAGALPR